ncbi:Hypothetical predicted protein [Pelobates cultripes]|uniref:Uncharacterized protein n=1 Tax=Pelobates cultripes TaxID=61616 RepID=A0AAD1S3Z1_PELCU|nr:Hypothetical predicted protein [Pelobates cultripes]
MKKPAPRPHLLHKSSVQRHLPGRASPKPVQGLNKTFTSHAQASHLTQNCTRQQCLRGRMDSQPSVSAAVKNRESAADRQVRPKERRGKQSHQEGRRSRAAPPPRDQRTPAKRRPEAHSARGRAQEDCGPASSKGTAGQDSKATRSKREKTTRHANRQNKRD